VQRRPTTSCRQLTMVSLAAIIYRFRLENALGITPSGCCTVGKCTQVMIVALQVQNLPKFAELPPMDALDDEP
jgi:hypothetical protein